jgi:hypothetical protein
MVKTVSELESRVKNYRENVKWWVCMHACVKDGKVGSFFFKKKWVTWLVGRKVRGS